MYPQTAVELPLVKSTVHFKQANQKINKMLSKLRREVGCAVID